MSNKRGSDISACIDSVSLWGNVEIPTGDDNGVNPTIPLFGLDGLKEPDILNWSMTKGWYVLAVSVIVSGLQDNVDFVHIES